MRNHRLLIFFFCLIPVIVFSSETKINKPNLLLANNYSSTINISDYWVSEKLDGIHAYWNGEKLISKQGNIIHSPLWFTAPLSKIPVDGELWIARGKFEEVSSIVRKKTPDDMQWKKVKYMLFDMPDTTKSFDERLKLLEEKIVSMNSNHIHLIKQYKVATEKILTEQLELLTKLGAEGLMLHLGSAIYRSGRSNDLLKYKKYFDAEAIVIGYIPGKGKYTGQMGSLIVERVTEKFQDEGIRFKIGSGFSDLERKNPPPIGSIITFKYYGLTKNRVPKFASFTRIRIPNP